MVAITLLSFQGCIKPQSRSSAILGDSKVVIEGLSTTRSGETLLNMGENYTIHFENDYQRPTTIELVNDRDEVLEVIGQNITSQRIEWIPEAHLEKLGLNRRIRIRKALIGDSVIPDNDNIIDYEDDYSDGFSTVHQIEGPELMANFYNENFAPKNPIDKNMVKICMDGERSLDGFNTVYSKVKSSGLTETLIMEDGGSGFLIHDFNTAVDFPKKVSLIFGVDDEDDCDGEAEVNNAIFSIYDRQTQQTTIMNAQIRNITVRNDNLNLSYNMKLIGLTGKYSTLDTNHLDRLYTYSVITGDMTPLYEYSGSISEENPGEYTKEEFINLISLGIISQTDFIPVIDTPELFDNEIVTDDVFQNLSDYATIPRSEEGEIITDIAEYSLPGYYEGNPFNLPEITNNWIQVAPWVWELIGLVVGAGGLGWCIHSCQVEWDENSYENSDYDGDGVNDWKELMEYQSNPCNPDSDGDGKADGNEKMDGTLGIPDEDGDGYTDAYETERGFDPFDADDKPYGQLQDLIDSTSNAHDVISIARSIINSLDEKIANGEELTEAEMKKYNDAVRFLHDGGSPSDEDLEFVGDGSGSGQISDSGSSTNIDDSGPVFPIDDVCSIRD